MHFLHETFFSGYDICLALSRAAGPVSAIRRASVRGVDSGQSQPVSVTPSLFDL
jgi:hypothetical protein